MYLDVVELRDFYAAPIGRMVARQLMPVLSRMLKSDGATRALGFGFATPYLESIAVSERLFAFMPAGQGVIDWPGGGQSATALVEEDSLPLPDASVDLIVLIHALELSAQPHALMAELRRVLTNGGRVVAVVPNRRGAWARFEVSPFGFGRPYSSGQVKRLFTEAGFEVSRWTTGLHMPPSSLPPFLSAAAALDRIGRICWPAFAGVIVVSAAKRTVQGVTVRVRPRLSPALRPALRPSIGLAGRSAP